MKRWKVNRVGYRGSAPIYHSGGSDYEAEQLEKYLNELEGSGWHVEGVEFHSNDKATIVSSRNISTEQEQSS